MKKVRIGTDWRSYEFCIIDPTQKYVGSLERTGLVTVKTLARWHKAIKEFNRAQQEMSEI